jgi:hypothetical protein
MNDEPDERDWAVVADFADWMQRGQPPRNSSKFNSTAYHINLPFNWGAPSTPP